jgi:large subunit ribosomal protein L35
MFGGRLAIAARQAHQESQMPKLKTKSGAKKRFKITGSGKVVSARDLRGTRVLFKSDGDNIKKYWMPNG